MNTTENTIEITQECSLHHYRTEIPNLIFHMQLDPYEFKGYCVLKMTAGDKGACFKSIDTLCAEIGCQRPKLIEIKKSLAAKGLIKLAKRKHANGGTMPDLITIVDIWGLNMQAMSQKYPPKGGGNLGLRGGVIQDYPNKNTRNKNKKNNNSSLRPLPLLLPLFRKKFRKRLAQRLRLRRQRKRRHIRYTTVWWQSTSRTRKKYG